MVEISETALDSATVNLACFEIGGTLYALDVSCIREIVRSVEVAPLPNAPLAFEGVVDLRGTLIPVVDLATLFGLGKTLGGKNARILVLEVEGMTLGLHVDSVTDVLTVDARRLDEVPELALRAGCDAVGSVTRCPGEAPIMVLSVESLLERIQDPVASSLCAEESGAAARGRRAWP